MSKSPKRLKALKANSSSKNKIKTKKSALKRLTVLSSGKVKAGHSNRSHNTGSRDTSRMNRLSKSSIIDKSKTRLVYRCLPNSF